MYKSISLYGWERKRRRKNKKKKFIWCKSTCLHASCVVLWYWEGKVLNETCREIFVVIFCSCVQKTCVSECWHAVSFFVFFGQKKINKTRIVCGVMYSMVWYYVISYVIYSIICQCAVSFSFSLFFFLFSFFCCCCCCYQNMRCMQKRDGERGEWEKRREISCLFFIFNLVQR